MWATRSLSVGNGIDLVKLAARGLKTQRRVKFQAKSSLRNISFCAASPHSACGYHSTPPRGRRHGHRSPRSAWQSVSIHASAREATGFGRAGETVGRGFYPRLGEGGDGPGRPGGSRHPSFYPRLREGGDKIPAGARCTVRRFYPRLREGGDGAGDSLVHADAGVSIHASAREATFRQARLVPLQLVSIHASAREATRS